MAYLGICRVWPVTGGNPHEFRFPSLCITPGRSAQGGGRFVSPDGLSIGVCWPPRLGPVAPVFGAEVFVVESIAISILREFGDLLTAIIVAGRTAIGLYRRDSVR